MRKHWIPVFCEWHLQMAFKDTYPLFVIKEGYALKEYQGWNSTL